MTSKQNAILSYIRDLRPGASISIRSLAAELQISEGTAYKAIKAAEAEGLVMTRDRAGTVRVDNTERDVSLTALAARHGLQPVSSVGTQGILIARVIPAVGSEAQLAQALSGSLSSTLCVCGDRPELMRLVIDRGAHLLLTEGATADAALLREADRHGCCILRSRLAGGTLLPALYASMTVEPGTGEDDAVENWMGMPSYLYQNDYISDFYRLYQPNASGLYKQPVVDDGLSVCGYLTANEAFTAPIGSKISQIFTREELPCTVACGDTMPQVLDRMLASESDWAYVLQDGKLEGVVGPRDLVRYFLYHRNNEPGAFHYEHAIQMIDRSKDGRHLVFQLRLPDTVQENDEVPTLILTSMQHAAGQHFQRVFGVRGSFQSATYYTVEERRFGGEVMLDSDIKKMQGNSAVVEVEMYDDIARYAHAVFILYATGAEIRRGG